MLSCKLSRVKFRFQLADVIYFWLLTIIIFSPRLQAGNQLKFQQYSTQQGLASSVVFDIQKDKNGFVWFATEEGVHKYDGYEFKWFKHNPKDEFSLSNNYTRCLALDNQSRIWVGSEAGLSIYLEDEGRFERFNFELEGEELVKANRIRTLYSDEDDVWIGSYAGLTRYKTKTKETKHYPHFPVRSVIRISDDLLLVGTLGKGSYSFNEKTGHFSKQQLTADPDLYRFNLVFRDEISITDILKVSANEILIASWGQGLYSYDISSRRVSRLELELPDQRIGSIKQASDGTYWIGTHRGLATFGRGFKKKYP